MLTADLVRARVVRGEVRPRYLDPAAEDMLRLAADLLAAFRAHLGQTREALDGALAALLGEGTDFLLHRGLAKLLADRSDFAVQAPCDPALLRRRLFEEAARHHPAVLVADAVHTVTRDQVVARVATELGIDPAAVTGAMYADLEAEHVLRAAPELSPDALLHRYNVALAQAVLLRATALTVRIAPGDPQRYRQLFRYVKFYRLLHQVSGTGATGYTLHLDGPLSLFQLSNKYGLGLAEFLPALLLCDAWSAEARVLWGPQRRPALFRVDPRQGLRSHYPDKGVYVTREEEHLLERFAALGSPWILERRSEILDLDGRGVLIPDFVVRHATDGRVALLEVVGFWKRDALEARLALLRDHGPKNLVLALPWRLRGSHDELDSLPGEVMVFKDVILARELLERVERIARAEPTSPPPAKRHGP